MIPELIETPRLLLRPYRLEDVDDVLAYATDPEWARFLPVPQPYGRTDAEAFIALQLSANREERPTWAVESAGTVIGGVSLRLHFDARVAELGYSVARFRWGQGIATEASRGIIDAAFWACPQLQRVRAMADARNPASLRVMEKLGMVREGNLRQNRYVRGELVDEVWCGVLRVEWRAHRDSGASEQATASEFRPPQAAFLRQTSKTNRTGESGG